MFLDHDVIKNYRRRAVAVLATALPLSLFFQSPSKGPTTYMYRLMYIDLIGNGYDLLIKPIQLN